MRPHPPLAVLAASDDSWRLAARTPCAALVPYIRNLEAYEERRATMVRRRALPDGGVVLVINFDAGWLVANPTAADQAARYTSFVAGVDDFASLVGCEGRAYCLQVNFTPLGARRFFGVPMHELARRVVPLDALLGADADRLADRLFQAPDPGAQFAILEAAIARRLFAAPAEDAGVRQAWRRIVDRHGAVAIGALAADLDCSRRHLIARFRDQIGLPPKSIAAISRFSRALALIGDAPRPDLAGIAADAGYFDQPHFNRDFQALAGITPGAFLRARMADGDGISA